MERGIHGADMSHIRTTALDLEGELFWGLGEALEEGFGRPDFFPLPASPCP